MQPGEVHLWFVELTADPSSLQHCSRILSADEAERASRYRFEDLRTSFTLARGVLRFLLARSLESDPAHLEFTYGTRGKPRLSFPESPLQFNLAHSGKLGAFAFSLNCELGVDIEVIRPMPDGEGIVRRFFCAQECDEWLSLDPSQRDDAFFRCWTRKEAYIKALGDGLSLPLDSFRVSLRPEQPAALLHSDRERDAHSHWSLYSIVPIDGYIASLAVPKPQADLHIHPMTNAAAIVSGVTAG